jgi:hypothetical protein
MEGEPMRFSKLKQNFPENVDMGVRFGVKTSLPRSFAAN